MKIAAASLAGNSLQRQDMPADTVENMRKKILEGVAASAQEKGKPGRVPAEEILDRIKALTGDGTYSVRFEVQDKTNELVTRIVDPESGEVIRQLPPEEMLELAARLEDLRGNLVDARS